jgi:HPt (histidine-containing phosphotransfer) domain-containing protein
MPQSGNAGVVNWDAALRHVGGDRDLLAELLEVYLQQSREWRLQLGSAVQRQDAAAIRADAHKIKGALGQFAADFAYQAAQRLELIGKHGNLAEAEVAHADLERELDRAAALFTTFIGKVS